MAWKCRPSRLVVWCAVGCFVCLLYISLLSLPNDSDVCRCKDGIETAAATGSVNSLGGNERGVHRLAIIVPFRDRFEELQEFVPHIHRFLSNQGVLHDIFIVNQVDTYRFNRASLINIGFLYSKNASLKYDYVAMHDVDLLPLNTQLRYEYPGDGSALHIASPKLHPKYHYENFVGGILCLTVGDFYRLNGLSNKYWGWGLEDDEFFLRMKQGSVKVVRPDHITTGPEDTFKHVHDGDKRTRDREKCFDQKAATRKRDRVTGLHDVAYKLDSVTSITVNSAPATILNVKLICDHALTPWCKCR